MEYLVLKIIVGLILVVAIVMVGGSLLNARSMAKDDDLEPVDDLTKFRQMRDEGKIDEEEFRRLKQAISEQTFGESESKLEKKENN